MNVFDLLKANGISPEEIETSDVGIYCTNRQRQIIFWNDTAEKITGYAKTAMIGTSCFQTGLNHKNIKNHNMCTGMCPLMETMADGEARAHQVSACCADGERKWMNVRTRALLYDGEICGVMEFFIPARLVKREI